MLAADRAAMAHVVCFVVTAHGYGHASRQMEVIRTLLNGRPDARAVVLTAAPDAVFRDYLGAAPDVAARALVVPFHADVGVVQRDGLAMDHEATLRELGRRFGDAGCDGGRAEAELAAALAVHRPAAVVADVPPVAFAAAARLGVPSVAVGNFDWAWIYGTYAEREPGFAPYARLCERWQALATAAVHLEPGPPLVGFRGVVDAAPVARRLLVDAAAVRARLGVPAGERAVLVSFGGFGLGDAARRIPRIAGVTWILAPPMGDLGRADARFVPDLPYLGLIAACDAVLTKPGYGIVCEAARQRTRLLYTDRGDFPEYAWLVRWMTENAPAVHVPAAELGSPQGAAVLAEAIERLFALPDRWPERWDGAARVVEVVEGLIQHG
jgi:hypothetical protein